jgi:hypothetical protein
MPGHDALCEKFGPGWNVPCFWWVPLQIYFIKSLLRQPSPSILK